MGSPSLLCNPSCYPTYLQGSIIGWKRNLFVGDSRNLQLHKNYLNRILLAHFYTFFPIILLTSIQPYFPMNLHFQQVITHSHYGFLQAPTLITLSFPIWIQKLLSFPIWISFSSPACLTLTLTQKDLHDSHTSLMLSCIHPMLSITMWHDFTQQPSYLYSMIGVWKHSKGKLKVHRIDNLERRFGFNRHG